MGNFENIELKPLNIFTGDYFDIEEIANDKGIDFNRGVGGDRVIYINKGCNILEFPESEMKPKDQINLARKIVQHVNKGHMFLIFTYSDYFIKELNILSMLNRNFKCKEIFLEKYPEYAVIGLDLDNAAGYEFEDGILKEVDKDELGFLFNFFDDTIDHHNVISNDLASLSEDVFSDSDLLMIEKMPMLYEMIERNRSVKK